MYAIHLLQPWPLFEELSSVTVHLGHGNRTHLFLQRDGTDYMGIVLVVIDDGAGSVLNVDVWVVILDGGR